LLDNTLTLNLIDNGKGFVSKTIREQDDKKERWGLAGMKERAALIEGQFYVNSTPGKGTEIKLIVHL
ncbi:MAG: diguanylate cyclase, partial [bacterium]|nr:diguanylate cyclase [bacterium]